MLGTQVINDVRTFSRAQEYQILQSSQGFIMFHPFQLALVSSLVHSSSFLQISLGLHTRHLTLSWAARLADQCRFARSLPVRSLHMSVASVVNLTNDSRKGEVMQK